MVLSPLYYGGQIKRDTRTLSSSRRSAQRIHTAQSVRATQYDTHTHTQVQSSRDDRNATLNCLKRPNQFFHTICQMHFESSALVIISQYSDIVKKPHLSQIKD